MLHHNKKPNNVKLYFIKEMKAINCSYDAFLSISLLMQALIKSQLCVRNTTWPKLCMMLYQKY